MACVAKISGPKDAMPHAKNGHGKVEFKRLKKLVAAFRVMDIDGEQPAVLWSIPLRLPLSRLRDCTFYKYPVETSFRHAKRN
eukprot:CAMPEP_0118649580 /NCGR_PEP_ID=MMETSP0785-20121206/9779_1 /TAXON_ID=91992 /ORGANISM="Bolidomonas pacifica, Strain CCMP 1866" /LENGTH=81 /DNA_ID=CAMNT_0006541877 /DNA_START=559 /DNA_END=805 /DNA_ORIENTATION=+